jgi:Protein of unknown function (DUF4232)
MKTRFSEKGAGVTMRKRTTLALLGAVLVASMATVLTVGTANASQASTPTCLASQLHGKRLDSSGAAGTVLFGVTLQNSGATCTLKGYSSLRLKGADGLLPTHVIHGGISVLNDKPKLVKIAHNGKASVLISYGDVPVGSETTCPAGKAIRLRPPNATGWLTIKVATTACGRGTLHESPVLSGVRSTH